MKAIEANKIAVELANAYNDMDEQSPEFEIVKARIQAAVKLGKFEINVNTAHYGPEEYVAMGNTMLELRDEGYSVRVKNGMLCIGWSRFEIAPNGKEGV